MSSIPVRVALIIGVWLSHAGTVRVALIIGVWHSHAGGSGTDCFCSNFTLVFLNTRPSVNNVSARLAMKNVANSDMHRDLQRVEN